MKTLGIIPARFNSSRFVGKPLAQICGKAMVIRVYEEAIKSKLDKIIVATDDERIASVLKNAQIPFMMTKNTKAEFLEFGKFQIILKRIYMCKLTAMSP